MTQFCSYKITGLVAFAGPAWLGLLALLLAAAVLAVIIWQLRQQQSVPPDYPGVVPPWVLLSRAVPRLRRRRTGRKQK